MKNSFDGTARGVMPLLMFGEDSTSEGLIKVLRMKPEIHKVFIITDEGVKNAGHLKPIEETLAGAGYESEVWDSVEQDPSEVTYDSIAAFGLKKKVDAVIGLGGGAVLDVAKCVALMQKNKGKILDYEMGKGVDPENVGVPWIGIPTTSGTGSEVSASSVITNSEIHRKTCVKSIMGMTPTAALLNPKLLTSMPKSLTASTGMDALSHAIEAYLVPVANVYSDVYAEYAIDRIVDNLPIVLKDGNNMEARGNLAMAASCAAFAFVASTLQIGHAIAHALGAALHVPHGIGCAWGIPYTIRRSGANEEQNSMARIKRLARLLQADISPEMSRGEILKACERKVIKMEEDFGIPKPTEFAGGSIASEECMLSAVDRCITYEQPMLQAGGANVTKDELEEFFRELWGWEYK